MFRFILQDQNNDYKEYSFEMKCTQNEFMLWVETQEHEVLLGDRYYSANRYFDFVADMESDYGVLDAGGTATDEGYISYEIEEDQYPELLEKFRVYFEQNGLV